MSILHVKNLTKIFFEGKSSFVAVDQLSFELNEGEILGILGPNGAGKTTTIEMLLGTLKPTSGVISYFGKELYKGHDAILHAIGHASSYNKLPGSLTVERNLDIIGRLYSIKSQARKARINELLTKFNMHEFQKARTSSLSAGQMTRLMLIKAFFAKPRILLLDEPTASLDPDIAEEVRSYILEQQFVDGVSIILTSHNMEEVAKMCGRALVLQRGRIIEEDTPQQLAKSVSLNKVKLAVVDMPRAIRSIEKLSLIYEDRDHSLTVEVEEQDVPHLLKRLILDGVDFTHIEMHKPTLEDYFLHISRQR